MQKVKISCAMILIVWFMGCGGPLNCFTVTYIGSVSMVIVKTELSIEEVKTFEVSTIMSCAIWYAFV